MKKATSLQGSLSRDSEANNTKHIDKCKPSSLNLAKGFNTLYSVTQARKPWFFNALNMIYIRVLSGIQNPFGGNTGSRSVAVLNHPMPSTHLFNKITGGTSHA
ncbi:MAG: hypothetical protein Q9M15_07780 [Mariprofundaceae bacterium]|nr:hypothetical protein [Mariprofundaceae bacterium]